MNLIGFIYQVPSGKTSDTTDTAQAVSLAIVLVDRSKHTYYLNKRDQGIVWDQKRV